MTSWSWTVNYDPIRKLVSNVTDWLMELWSLFHSITTCRLQFITWDNFLLQPMQEHALLEKHFCQMELLILHKNVLIYLNRNNIIITYWAPAHPHVTHLFKHRGECHFSPFKAIRTSDQIRCVSHQMTSRPAATPPSPSISWLAFPAFLALFSKTPQNP